jgi:predicted AlkP superfamily pyrophosphatase or phosphodiesterase
LRAWRAALAAAALVLTGAVATTATASADEPGPLRVYVVVLDGLKPSEVGALTPTLSALRAQGTWYEQARAVFPAETLPNHVAMMTGVLPRRNGIIGNQYWLPNDSAAPDYYMNRPELLEADTLTTRLEDSCGPAVSTATVQSKTYLHGVFQGEAARPGDPNPQRESDFHWTAPWYIPVSDHAPDVFTMEAFRAWVREQPSTLPQFAFVNLGDIDRAGHADEIGGSTSGASTPARQAAIADTDTQLGLLVDDLRQSGAWEDTVLVLASDHSMDWGPYHQQIEIQAALSGAGY